MNLTAIGSKLHKGNKKKEAKSTKMKGLKIRGPYIEDSFIEFSSQNDEVKGARCPSEPGNGELLTPMRVNVG